MSMCEGGSDIYEDSMDVECWLYTCVSGEDSGKLLTFELLDSFSNIDIHRFVGCDSIG